MTPSFNTNSTCRHDEPDEQPGNDEHVHREKPRQRCAGDDRASQQQIDQPGPDDGNSAHNRGANAQSPIGVLIESQHLACKGHAERHQQKHDAEHPRQLTRILVGAEQEDLHHVDQDDGHHEIRAPAVQGSNEPSQGDVVIEDLQAVPGFPRGRHIDESQAESP